VEYVTSSDVPQRISAETFVRGILASTSEPVFTKPIQVFEEENGHPLRDHLFYDGGVREFLPLEFAANEGASSIWAVSTHPPEFKPTDWGNSTSPDDVSILKALKWVIDTTLNEVERGDLFRALAYYRLGRARDRIRAVAASENFDDEITEVLLDVVDDIFPDLPDMVGDFHVIYPSRPMSASLEFDPAVMLSYFTNGILEARTHFDNGDPQFVDAGNFVFDLG
jgi:hypothetical protein